MGVNTLSGWVNMKKKTRLCPPIVGGQLRIKCEQQDLLYDQLPVTEEF